MFPNVSKLRHADHNLGSEFGLTHFQTRLTEVTVGTSWSKVFTEENHVSLSCHFSARRDRNVTILASFGSSAWGKAVLCVPSSCKVRLHYEIREAK